MQPQKGGQKNLGPPPQSLPAVSYEFGFRGAADAKGRQPYNTILANTTHSGFLEDTASDHLSQPLIAARSAFDGHGGSSAQMRATAFTARSKNVSSASNHDKSRLIIPAGQDHLHTLALMVDGERVTRKAKKKASIDARAGSNNALVELKLKSNYQPQGRVFEKRKRSQAVKASEALGDLAAENIPRGSPRMTKIEHLDSPERSNALSHVISYRDKASSALPPLAAASKTLAQKQSARKINHNFNVDFNNNAASKYYDLQKKSKEELEREFPSIVKEPTKMPKLVLK